MGDEAYSLQGMQSHEARLLTPEKVPRLPYSRSRKASAVFSVTSQPGWSCWALVLSLFFQSRGLAPFDVKARAEGSRMRQSCFLELR